MKTASITAVAILGCVVSAWADGGQQPAQDVTAVAETLQLNINIVWTAMAAFLVFFMQAGFAMLEAGFTQA